MESENVAFPAQQVVLDTEARHGVEVAPDDAIGQHVGDPGGGVDTVLKVLEDSLTVRQPGFVLIVPPGYPGIQIPAVVVESRRLGERPYFVDSLVLELAQPDHHVGDLHASVIDVVLDFDVGAPISQQPTQGIAERGVAQVPDVSRLVGIDRRVLDDRLDCGSGLIR